MNFKVREFAGRYDIYYVDADQEIFIVSCRYESNAKLIAKILFYDRERNAIVDYFERKNMKESILQGHREVKTWDKEVAEN